jgi:chromosome segregation ATPase
MVGQDAPGVRQRASGQNRQGQQMTQIDDHERRLAAALARIGAALEQGAEPGADATTPEAPDSAAEVEAARLTRALDEARAENAALAARLDLARDRQAATVATLETRVASLTQQIDAQGIEVQRLRMVNVQLREALRSLREALTDGVTDAGQINRALQAENEAMRAARQIETSELDRLLAALEPHVAEAEAAAHADAPPEEAPDA